MAALASRLAAGLLPAAAALALGVASCGSCSDEAASSGRAEPGGRVRTLATVPGPVGALAAGRGQLFGVSRSRGVVFAVSTPGIGPDAGVRDIAEGEHEPFALVVRAGKPVWASASGVFASDEDGRNRRALVEGRAVRALGAGPHDVLFGDDRGIWRVEWPASANAVRVVDGVLADEVVASLETVFWLERGPGDVWAFDLKSGTRRQLAKSHRTPRDLSLASDGRSASWHEGDGRAFLGDGVTGAVRALAGIYEPGGAYVVHAPCVFGPGVCKPVAEVDWITLDPASSRAGPIAVDSGAVYWVEPTHADVWRVMSAPLSTCCE